MQFVIASTFTRSLEQLDKSTQDQIKKSVFDFQINPDTPGNKLHRIEKSKDKDFWSIRVSDDIRIILHKRDDRFTFCYADHHDEAYAWAERRRFTIHPQTGAAQIVEIVERVEEVVKQVQKEGEPALFSNYEPSYLLSLGVPLEWLAAVRNIGESGLWKLKDHLPEEAFERLFSLAAGDPVPIPVATPTGQNPLTHPDAQRRFKVLDNQNELKQALDYPWERWLVFLHPAQKTIVEKKFQGPALVSGSAGTGKTVCALHRAAFLVRKNPGHKVLLTTFSRTLAARLSQSAELLQLTSEERKRLQIKHLHSIARELYTEHTRKSFSPLRPDEVNKLIEETQTTLSVNFLRAEWESIVDARGITTWAVYKSTSRAGRGTAISVKQRQEAWKSFEHVYQRANARGQMTWSRLCHEVIALLAEKESGYHHIIADECQDFGPSELRLLRALVASGPDDIFLAGDAGQRIYRMPFSWSSAGIDVKGRSSRLKINYRTTEQIRSFSDGLMPESVEEASGNKESRATVSVLDGPKPELQGFATKKEEAKGVATWLENLRKEGYQPRDIAIFTRTEDLLKERAEEALKALGISGHYLSDDQPPSAKDIALGSMHRAKGLEFRVVVVMGCEQNKVPLPFALRGQEDEADKDAFLAQERQLLYVACTRARERLLITYTGSPSRFLVPAEPIELFPKTGVEIPPDANTPEETVPVTPGLTDSPSPKDLERGLGGEAPRFKVSPSTVARYFYHDCERFLRFRSTPGNRHIEENIPAPQKNDRLLMGAIFQSGYDWEAEVLKTYLADKVSIAGGDAVSDAIPLHTRRFVARETIERLRQEPIGRFIYQATLRAPRQFYTSIGLDPTVAQLHDNFPDLIAVEAGENGKRRFRIIDLKRGASLKYTYRIQVLLYALQLDAIVKDAQIQDAYVDLDTGGIWLGKQSQYTETDFRSLRPSIEHFLSTKLEKILQQPSGEASWHVYYRCEWCEYFPSCWEEMTRRDDLSQLTQLTPYAKRFLVKEKQTQTLSQLSTMLAKDGADEQLAGCASLQGKKHLLQTRLASFAQHEPRTYGSSSSILPRFSATEVSLFITLQEEPLGGSVYLAGIFVSPTRAVELSFFGRDGNPGAQVFVAKTQSETKQLRRDFITALLQAMEEVHEYNETKPNHEKLSLQVYTNSPQEEELLLHTLLDALDEPETAEQATELLLHFQGPDLLLADEHPDDAPPYPLVSLLSALYQLLALPVPVSYRLDKSLSLLASFFPYAYNESIHFPLGHGFKSDLIYRAWYRGEDKLIDELQQHGRRYLHALRALLHGVRSAAKEHLFVWPPKFSLHSRLGIKDPLLSRLAFFCRYESLLEYRSIHAERTAAFPVQKFLGYVIELEALSAERYKISTEQAITIEADPGQLWLLVRATEAGRRAQLQHPDYQRSNQPRRIAPNTNLALVNLTGAISDDLGFSTELVLDFSKGRKFEGPSPVAGEKFWLYQLFVDYNSPKVIKFLQELDASPSNLFVSLLKGSTQSLALSLPEKIEKLASTREASLRLTTSQLAAYRRIREQRVVAVLGPPGTGKTHFLASMILGMARAHRESGASFRVLVTAFTHAAIENLLKKIAQLSQDELKIGKAKGWKGAKHGDEVEDKKISDWLSDNKLCVLGATVYSCLNARRGLDGFDLVVVDEASQVRVPEAAIPASLLAESGRLVLAGDDKQLPPIVTGRYPTPTPGEPVLHQSVFQAIRSVGEVCTLNENFRMNDVLTGFAAKLLYGEGYRCVSEKVASARLQLARKKRGEDWLEVMISPENPLVLAVLDGVPPGKESALEAELVASVVAALRERMKASDGKVYKSDEPFFKDGVFIVSPHHSQIRLIRRALKSQRNAGWSSPPFVDTVDKMQGQEAEAVIVSYGVSDPEFALQEAVFIYGQARLNVAMTRARTKTILFLTRALLDATPQVIETPEAEEGVRFMRSLFHLLSRKAPQTFSPQEKIQLRVYTSGNNALIAET